jgi:hypothetical protein
MKAKKQNSVNSHIAKKHSNIAVLSEPMDNEF